MRTTRVVLRQASEGVLTVNIDQKMPLSEVVEAHRLLESGKTTGSTLLIP